MKRKVVEERLYAGETGVGARCVTGATRRVTGCGEGAILTNAGGFEGEVGGWTALHTLRGLREEDERCLTGETISRSGASAGGARAVAVMTESLEGEGGRRACLIAHVSGVGEEVSVLAGETVVGIRAVTGRTRRMAL